MGGAFVPAPSPARRSQGLRPWVLAPSPGLGSAEPEYRSSMGPRQGPVPDLGSAQHRPIREADEVPDEGAAIARDDRCADSAVRRAERHRRRLERLGHRPVRRPRPRRPGEGSGPRAQFREATNVVNGSLKDEDIGQGVFVDFTGSIGIVPALSCVEKPVSGVNARGDHLLLTANWNSQDPDLVYGAEYDSGVSGAGRMIIQVCNPTPSQIDDGTTRFNLLVFNAQ
jgi:hypothetical protein